MSFDPTVARSQFPALRRRVDGRAALYLDGPGGTQVPRPVIDAVAAFMASLSLDSRKCLAPRR